MVKANLKQIINTLFKELDPKESEILRSRFGLSNKEKGTLEAIGQNYGLSKERIRQVQNQALNKLRQLDKAEKLITEVKNDMIEFLEQKRGIAKEKIIFEKSEKPEILIFIMSQFFQKDLERIEDHPKLETVWKLKSLSLGLVENVLNEALNIINERKTSIKKEEFLELLKNSLVYRKNDLDDQYIFSFIEASCEIEENILGEYGLAHWREIVPKRISDKIYLVFRQENKPLHFEEITKKINELNFDHKTAYPRAVHNELILDERFVLIGRGVYALKDWGYQSGTVKDILNNILKETKKPLTREELAKKVGEQRVVKESTIYTALMDKAFKKLEDGRYTLY